MESKEYSWKWVTADELLSHGPCDFLYAHFIPKSAATATSLIYANTEASGDIISSIRTAESRACEIDPPVPLYCPKGLYIDIAAQTKGILVVWRELGEKG